MWFLVANVDISNHQNKHAPTPKGSRPYFDSSAPHIRTHPRQRLVLWNKAKPNTHLSKNKATSASDRRPSHSLSSLQRWKADTIFTRVRKIVTPYLHQTRAVRCGATKYYRTHYNQWCCLHWMGHDKSPTVNCCRVLFMTYWHKFQILFNGRFVASSVDRLYLLRRGVTRQLSGVDTV